jgi:hypothetical protein
MIGESSANWLGCVRGYFRDRRLDEAAKSPALRDLSVVPARYPGSTARHSRPRAQRAPRRRQVVSNIQGLGAERPGDAFGQDCRERPEALGGAELADALVFLPPPRAHNVHESKTRSGRSWRTGLFSSRINCVRGAGKQIVAFSRGNREPLQNHYSPLSAKPW